MLGFEEFHFIKISMLKALWSLSYVEFISFKLLWASFSGIVLSVLQNIFAEWIKL